MKIGIMGCGSIANTLTNFQQLFYFTEYIFRKCNKYCYTFTIFYKCAVQYDYRSSIIASRYPLSHSIILSFFATLTAGVVKYWFVMTTPTMQS